MQYRNRAALWAACAFLGCGSLLRAVDPAPAGTTAPAGTAPSIITPPLTLTPPAPAQDPDRRNLPPAPLDSPPFPTSDWTGPDPEPGMHDSTLPGALENNLKGTSFGNALINDLKIHPYGWIDIGGNYSSSKHSNSPESYNLLPNAIVLDQAVLRLERFVDSAQEDHIDWGFRLSLIYGTDYRYTVAKGYFDEQLYQHNNLYGGDFPEAFAEIYIPHVADGLIIKIGRYISPADVEAQLAPQNYLYSHSNMFSFDPYTYTGINTHWKIDKNYALEFGVDFGNDQAPWVSGSSLNGLAMIRWWSDSGYDGFYGGLNQIGAGRYQHGHDDLQQAVFTYAHRFDDRWHTQIEGYYMWQYNALAGSDVIFGPSQSFAPSGPLPHIKGIADEWGVVQYIEYEIDKATYASLRYDVLDDMKGQRTGYRTTYTEITLGIAHNFTPWLTFRPEVRWDRSWQVPAYDNGVRKNQYTVAGDVIIWF